MKSCVLDDIGKLNIKEITKPSLSDNEVLISVRAAGICGSDIPRVYKTGTYSFPMVIGHEFAGEVVETGDNCHSNLTGRRVGVFPLIPCMSCEMCKNSQYEMCSNYGYIGSRQDGAFAEYVKVPEWNLIELPDNVSYEQAAMLEPLSVVVHAARNAGLLLHSNKSVSKFGIHNSPQYNTTGTNSDINIAIIGLGTIGLLLAMVLVNAGYKNIYVIGNKELQKQKVVEIGIPEVNYFDNPTAKNPGKINEDLLSDFLKSKDINIFFECVGNIASVNTAIDNTAPNGKVVLVGNPAGDMVIDKQIYWKVLRRQLTLIGTWNSSFTKSEDDDWHYALREISSGNLRPEILITHTYQLDNIISGFELMHDKKEEYIKVMSTFISHPSFSS